jgi:hypothetical protein
VGADGSGPLGCNGPHVRVGSEAGSAAPTCLRRCMHTKVAGRAGPAKRGRSERAATTAAAACGQVRQQRAGGWVGAACMQCGARLGKVGGGGAVQASLL